MIHVECFSLSEEVSSLIGVAESVVAEGEHIEAMDAVLRVEFIASFPDEQVRQRNGKVVHGLMLKQVLQTVVHESPETAVGLFVASEPAQGHTLIEDLVGLGIVVVHSRSRFLSQQSRAFSVSPCIS